MKLYVAAVFLCATALSGLPVAVANSWPSPTPKDNDVWRKAFENRIQGSCSNPSKNLTYSQREIKGRASDTTLFHSLGSFDGDNPVHYFSQIDSLDYNTIVYDYGIPYFLGWVIFLIIGVICICWAVCCLPCCFSCQCLYDRCCGGCGGVCPCHDHDRHPLHTYVDNNRRWKVWTTFVVYLIFGGALLFAFVITCIATASQVGNGCVQR
eukprot:GHVU01059270.1.p1 GENE.GHVU01059270.1~~GHVU01059270.1.p1  ORF type:complete len:209 (+),score=1.09 GHVU01059270.1:357-983(+)